MKDSLTLYEELVANGVPEAQAKIQAHQLGETTSFLWGIKDVLTKIEKDLGWMQIIGGAMAVAFFGNIITVFVTILCIK